VRDELADTAGCCGWGAAAAPWAGGGERKATTDWAVTADRARVGRSAALTRERRRRLFRAHLSARALGLCSSGTRMREKVPKSETSYGN
jgi:hypothetical protein